jgi:hypothetical protein
MSRHPVDIQYYAGWCGPAAVASATGMGREQAAAKLAEVKRPGRGRITSIHTIGAALNLPVLTVRGRRPTLTQWVQSDGRDAIVRASHHFVHIRDGRVVEDNGLRQPRARVTHVILLPKGDR